MKCTSVLFTKATVAYFVGCSAADDSTLMGIFY